MTPLRLTFSDHAILRMFQRQVSARDVREAFENGEVLEEYPNDTPFPSRLVLGRSGARWLHVLTAHNPEVGTTIVITVYEPDPDLWEPPDFRQRRA